MDINKNYYEVLGVDKNAQDIDIKKIYRKKAIETHPDKCNDDVEFKKINDAYQVIGDKNKRNEYDKRSLYGKNYNPNNNFFGNRFNVNFEGVDWRHWNDIKSGFNENLDINLNIKVNLNDVYNNKCLTIKYNRNITCDVCNGTGFDPESESYECSVCDGVGKSWSPINGWVNCKYCRGSGKIHNGTCKKCNGEKVILKDEEFHLNNVYRIKSNDSKYLGGRGSQSKHYMNKRGNLILNIIYDNNNEYIIKEDGLYYKIDIHYEDAINGKDINYHHLDGKDYILKILSKTKDGGILKMPSKGLLININDRQNLYFLINVVIDYNRVQ